MTHRYRIHLCYDVEGWCYHNRVTGIAKYAPPEFSVTVGSSRDACCSDLDYDLVLQLCYGQCKTLRRRRDKVGSRALITAGYNVGWGYRGEYYSFLKEHADHVIFNNFDNWIKHGKPPATTHISNGVDRDVFKPMTSVRDRKHRVLWTGSEFHLRNHDIKGYASLLQPLARRLQQDGLPTEYWLVESHAQDKRTPLQMAEWYNTGTIYVVASEREGTPNPALEAASCGAVVCSTRVGNMPELITHGINGVLVDRTLDDLRKGILLCRDRYEAMATASLETIQWWDWKYRAAQYYATFKRLIERKP